MADKLDILQRVFLLLLYSLLAEYMLRQQKIIITNLYYTCLTFSNVHKIQHRKRALKPMEKRDAKHLRFNLVIVKANFYILIDISAVLLMILIVGKTEQI